MGAHPVRRVTHRFSTPSRTPLHHGVNGAPTATWGTWLAWVASKGKTLADGAADPCETSRVYCI